MNWIANAGTVVRKSWAVIVGQIAGVIALILAWTNSFSPADQQLHAVVFLQHWAPYAISLLNNVITPIARGLQQTFFPVEDVQTTGAGIDKVAIFVAFVSLAALAALALAPHFFKA